MENVIKEKNIRRLFVFSIILKGIHAILETIAGILFLFTASITGLIGRLIAGELIEDPNDFIANRVQQYIPYLSPHSQLFAAIYLLSHGIIKIFLVVALLRNKLWAYPASIIVFSLFILYQLYRFIYTRSPVLVILTIFDVLIIWLTWHEYQHYKLSIKQYEQHV